VRERDLGADVAGRGRGEGDGELRAVSRRDSAGQRPGINGEPASGQDRRTAYTERIQPEPSRTDTHPDRLTRRVMGGQLCLLGKDRKAARAEYRRAEQFIADTPDEITYDPLLMACHWRNGLRLKDPRALKEFPARIKELRDQGYRFLAPLCDEFGISG